ncbi:DUF488 domain-containing protein [Hydrotalea sp.]|uniref:DUF488 domain-containing protein n=1 Tax=Hydrotalea sp. TaxID=2881279 RepID=UPI003D13D1D5
MGKDIFLKRVYDTPSTNDGFRVLVDRVWPRGLTKEKAKVDLWLKDIAPSSALRKWFAHDINKWPAFVEKYQAELKLNKSAVNTISQIASKQKCTLLFGAKDTEHNQAVVLLKFLQQLKI